MMPGAPLSRQQPGRDNAWPGYWPPAKVASGVSQNSPGPVLAPPATHAQCYLLAMISCSHSVKESPGVINLIPLPRGRVSASYQTSSNYPAWRWPAQPMALGQITLS